MAKRAALAEWHVDEAKVAEGERLIGALRAADNTQETSVRTLPEKTRELYLAKGNLYLDLKRITRRGRRRFVANPAQAGVYTLDLTAAARPKPAAPT